MLLVRGIRLIQISLFLFLLFFQWAQHCVLWNKQRHVVKATGMKTWVIAAVADFHGPPSFPYKYKILD